MKKCFLLLLVFQSVISFGQDYFSHGYDIVPGFNKGDNIVILDDGYVISSLTGCPGYSCISLIKVGLDGSAIWIKTLNEVPYYIQIQDTGEGMFVNDSGNIICLAQKFIDSSIGVNTVMIEIAPSDGTIVNYSELVIDDFRNYPVNSYQRENGEYTIYGYDREGTQDSTIYYRKIVTLNEDLSFKSEFILQDQIDNIVFGNVIPYDNDHFVIASWYPVGDNSRPIVQKYNYDGTLIWSTDSFGLITVSGQIVRIRQRPEGGFYLLHFGENPDFNLPGWLIPRVSGLNENGLVEWSTFLYTSGAMKVRDIIVAPNGDLLGCGHNTDGNLDGGLLFRMSPNGEELWRRYIADTRYNNGLNRFLFEDIEVSDLGGIALTGIIADTVGTGGLPDIKAWLVATDSNGCIEPDCEQDILISSADEVSKGLEDVEEYIYVYPNPTSDFLFIRYLAKTEDAHVNFFDLTGKLVKRQVLNRLDPAHTVGMHDLPTGMYVFNIIEEGQLVSSGKVIVE